MTIAEALDCVFGRRQIELGEEQRAVVRRSHDFLESFSREKVIYGINTGFGPMAQWRVADDDLNALQYNIVRSHTCGSFLGGEVDPWSVRAAMLSRLRCFVKGYSGVSWEVVRSLAGCLNAGVTPRVPLHGSVGASGDLVQLAHIALALIGEGEVRVLQLAADGHINGAELRNSETWGAVIPAAEALEQCGLQPLQLTGRDGLALVNGTAVMTGISLLNVRLARNLLALATRVSLMVNEVVESYDDLMSLTLNAVRGQQGQQLVAATLRHLASDSQLLRHREAELFNAEAVGQATSQQKVQAYYSLRCAPQILGPVYETIENMACVVEQELDAVDDNPIVAADEQNVLHGGNFHGDYISLENDKLKMVVTRLAMLLERQSNYLMHSRLNDLLPPFCNRARLGLDYALQPLQFTMTSTTAECQTLAMSNYVHSIPCNADNQDIVSMGTNSAALARRVLDNALTVTAVALITAAQAADCRNIQDRLSTSSRELLEVTRQHVVTLTGDRRHDLELAALENDLLLRALAGSFEVAFN